MSDKNFENIIRRFGYTDFKIIDARDIEVANWVRFKCMFGCPSYGAKASCPPQTPPIDECREFFSGYKRSVIFHFSKKLDHPEDRKKWGKEINDGLIRLEREVFMEGYYKAFMLFMDECQLCYECALARTECHNKSISRPCPEALGVDVFATVQKYGFPIRVLKEYGEEMDRYAILLIE